MTGRLEACIRLAQKINVRDKRILDIGCSYPWFIDWALKNGAKSVSGVEPDLQKVLAARKQVPKAKILQGHAGDLKFPNKSFNMVTLFDVIEHIPPRTEPEVLREINRVLKPGGHLIISTPLRHWFSTVTDPAWYFGHRHYSKKQLSEMLKKAGFRVKSVITHGGIWEITGMWVLYISKWVLRTKMLFEDWFDSKRRKEFEETGFTHIMLIAQKTT